MNTQKETLTWFSKAIPSPSTTNKRVQFAVHVEEFAEMLECVEAQHDSDLQLLLTNLLTAANKVSTYMKTYESASLTITNPVEFLDSLCDQQVTANGVGYMHGYEMHGALTEVVNSNNSKFVNGEPIFNEQGKIAKGPGYFTPSLAKFCTTH